MILLNATTHWLNGPHAGTTMLVLRIACFACFVGAAIWLVVGRRRAGGSRSGYPLLAVLTLAAWGGILAAQFNWQILGARNIAFMRFMRTHNARPASLVRRGSILDRNGTVLAIDDPLPGQPWNRRYPLGAAAAHVVGYFDAQYGMAGMERAGDPVLSGIGGTARDELARLGRNIMAANQAEGGDLRLTVDARLQRKAHALMEGRKGAVVVLRANAGAVKVLLSMPAFDPRSPAEALYDRVNAPMLNRALQGLYPPGSTFKIVMAALAGEQRLSPVFNCPGEGFRAARDARPIRDSDYYIRRRENRAWDGFGRIGLRDGFVHSSNVYFAQLGLACPAEAFNAFVTRLHLNARVVLFESIAGRLATGAASVPQVTATDRKTRAQLAIGQGRMVVTPLHVALWTAAVAAGGELHPPILVEGQMPAAERIMPRAVAANTRGLMREAVLHGTGRAADIPGLAVCGKTGTAQAPGGEDHAWFTCFASGAEPPLVVTVLVERGGYGSRGALPVARALLEEAVRLEIITPAPRRSGRPAE
jgi:penicillin-binding protein A